MLDCSGYRTEIPLLYVQVFHWLYELSVAIAALPPGGLSAPQATDPTVTPETPPISPARLEEAVGAAIALSMNVVDIAEASGRQNLLVILLPLFCDLLQDEKAGPGEGVVQGMVHGLALKSLLAMGSRYPAEFRHVVAKVPNLKPRIEAAARTASHNSDRIGASTGAPTSTGGSVVTNSAASSAAAPTAIKLKMEFSNFS